MILFFVRRIVFILFSGLLFRWNVLRDGMLFAMFEVPVRGKFDFRISCQKEVFRIPNPRYSRPSEQMCYWLFKMLFRLKSGFLKIRINGFACNVREVIPTESDSDRIIRSLFALVNFE